MGLEGSGSEHVEEIYSVWKTHFMGFPRGDKEHAGERDINITKKFIGGSPFWAGLTVGEHIIELESRIAMRMIESLFKPGGVT